MKTTTQALLLLLILDLVFVTLHVSYSYGYLQDKHFKISLDGGYAEWFQYFKFVAAGAVLAYLARRLRSAVLVFWSVLAFALFLDDWLRIHESIGGKVLGGYLKPFIDRAYHQGQLLYGGLAAVVIALIGLRYWRRSTGPARQMSIRLFLSLGLVWFSAVGIDYLHGLLPGSSFNLYLVLAEEGGEHLGASLFLWSTLLGVAAERAYSRAASFAPA